MSPYPPAVVESESETTIRDNIIKIRQLKKQVKDKKKLVNEELKKNSAYQMANDEVKEKQRDRTAVKKKVIADNNVLAGLNSDIKTINSDIKMRMEVLSENLIEYERNTGQLTIPGIDVQFEKVIKPLL